MIQAAGKGEGKLIFIFRSIMKLSIITSKDSENFETVFPFSEVDVLDSFNSSNKHSHLILEYKNRHFLLLALQDTSRSAATTWVGCFGSSLHVFSLQGLSGRGVIYMDSAKLVAVVST